MIRSAWSTAPEKLSKTYRNWSFKVVFCPFYHYKKPNMKILKNKNICWRFHHFTHVKQNFVILGHFLPFQPHENWKNQNFKTEKTPRDIMILQIWTIWQSWSMVLEIWTARQNFFPILRHFLPFFKTTQEDYNFTQVYHKWQSYDVWFLRYEGWQKELFCHFGPLFTLLPSKKPEK